MDDLGLGAGAGVVVPDAVSEDALAEVSAMESMAAQRVLEQSDVVKAMRFRWMVVMPALAERWLTLNTHNRQHKRERIDTYAGDIERGAWQVNPQPIVFSSDGVLVDGQHRLMAVVRSGQPIWMLVVTDAPMVTQDAMDNGAVRTIWEQLELNDEIPDKSLGATIRQVSFLANGLSHKTAKLTHHTAREVIAEYKNGLRWRATVDVRPGLAPSTYMGVLVWMYDYYQHEVELFHLQVQEGTGLKSGDPALTLRDWLAARSAGKGGNGNKEVVLKTCSALAAAIRQRSTRKLQVGNAGYEDLCTLIRLVESKREKQSKIVPEEAEPAVAMPLVVSPPVMGSVQADL